MDRLLVLNMSKKYLQAILAAVVRQKIETLLNAIQSRPTKEACVIYSLNKSIIYKLIAILYGVDSIVMESEVYS